MAHPPGHRNYLDGWRTLAIIGVLCDHFITADTFNAGRFGVELFFVLSGRLMAEILFVKRMPLPNFLAHRFARVYPALLVYFLVGALVVVPLLGAKRDIGSTVAALTFTLNYYSQVAPVPLWLQQVWTLCIEAHMYVLLAIAAALVGRRMGAGLVLIALVAAAFVINGWWLTAHGLGYYNAYWRSDVRGASILMGAVAYLALAQLKLEQMPAWLVPILLVASITLNLSMVPDTVKYSAGSVLIAAAVALLDVSPAAVTATLGWRGITWIGVVSYSLYLWQQMFAFLVPPIPPLPRVALILPALAVAMVSYRLVEVPARRWLNGLTDSRLRGRSAPTAATGLGE